MTPFDLGGKRAVICGLCHDVGAATARALAGQGAEVFMIESDAALGSSTAEAIAQTGGRAHLLAYDPVSVEGLGSAFAEVAEAGDRLDILVTVANRAHRGALADVPEDELGTVIEANTMSVYRAMRAALPLLRRKGGAIVNVASIFASVALPDRFAYMASKAAVVAMTKSVATDYAHENVRCNCVSAGRLEGAVARHWVRATYPGREAQVTEELETFHPLGRMGRPEEVAAQILFLCSDEAAFITGQDVIIDGGVTAMVKETITAEPGM